MCYLLLTFSQAFWSNQDTSHIIYRGVFFFVVFCWFFLGRGLGGKGGLVGRNSAWRGPSIPTVLLRVTFSFLFEKSGFAVLTFTFNMLAPAIKFGHCLLAQYYAVNTLDRVCWFGNARWSFHFIYRKAFRHSYIRYRIKVSMCEWFCSLQLIFTS